MTENSKTLLSALLAVQAEAPKLQKDKINPAFKSRYLSLDTLMEQALPTLSKHGLVWITRPADRPNGPVLHYTLAHAESGQQLEGEMPLMLDKQNSQGLGSAITYARRQSFMAVFGFTAGEDDDGNAASQRERRPPAPKLSKVEHATVDLGDERPMTDEELEILLKAVPKRELGLLLASVGAEGAEELSVKQGREMMRRMKVTSPGLDMP